MTALTIPQTVSTIYSTAFNGCTSLKTIVIEDSSNELEINNSYGGLSDENFPLDSLYLGRNISRWFDSGKLKNLTKVAIGDKVTTLKVSLFKGSTKLTNVHIGKNIQLIGEYAFSECTSLKHIDLTCNAWAVAYRAFYKCTGLENVILPPNVIMLGGRSFENCYSLKSIKIPQKVTMIGYSAFENCKSLKEAIIEEGSDTLILESSSDIFSNCPLDSVYLGKVLAHSNYATNFAKTVTNISPFPNCLKKICIGQNASLYNTSLSGNTSLTHIYATWITPPTFSKLTFSSNTYSSATLHVPNGTIPNYQATAAWNEFANIVETKTTPDTPSIKKGDLNGDGVVSITDVVMIIDVIAGTITDANQVAAADVNGDGSVTITDCVAAIDLIAEQ